MNVDTTRDEFLIRNQKIHFGRLLSYIKPHIPLFLLCTVFSLLVNAATVAKPYIVKYVIDEHLVSGKPSITVIRFMGILYFVLIVLSAALTYAQTYFMTYIGQKIMYRIRNQLFEHVQKMSMRFFDKNSSGKILTRVTNDVESLDEIFSGILIDFFRELIMIAGIIIAMFTIDVKLALIGTGCVPVIALVTFIYRIAARKNFIKMKGMITRINGFLAENISGMKIVKIFHREKEKYNELQELEREYFKLSFREVILNGLGRPAMDIINNFTIALLIWFCVGKVLNSSLDIGILYAFIAYIKQFFEPISALSEQYTTIQSAFISAKRIFEILDNKEDIEDLYCGQPIEKLKGDIEFKNVWFAYNDEDWVLKDVSFKISSGETVAFVGATGSGKSTIISLMARFYDIQRGEILIDGKNIKEYRLHDLRKHIAVVLQDVFLFTGDIKSNIRLKNNSITDNDIKNAALLVGADQFIESLPCKYDEEVKEKGCTFSSGQRQLISFVRAIAFKPSILVLDEATANIDTETEIMIQNAMARMSENRTCIIIAHRLSTVKNADKIIVLHKGCIKETGNHADLLRNKGIYSQLYNLQ